MQIIWGLENLKSPDRPAVITVGNFDGVHLGHQAIMRRVVQEAKNAHFLPVVMTFEFHPLKLLAPASDPGLLMPLEERFKIMDQIGIERVVVARCVWPLLKMERDEFIRDVLVNRFGIKVIVEGPNFRFGCDRTGDIDYLIQAGPRFRFEAVKIDPAKVDLDELGVRTVSSSLARMLIASGRVDLARRCLGRPYQLFGRVILGFQRGKSLGFPTANLDVGEQVLPENGIYAAKVQAEESLHPAAVVIGPAPTFDQFQVVVEAFLLDYEGDLYGKNITPLLYRRLRDIMKFKNPSELVRQIQRDVQAVRDVLKQEEKTNHDSLR